MADQETKGWGDTFWEYVLSERDCDCTVYEDYIHSDDDDDGELGKMYDTLKEILESDNTGEPFLLSGSSSSPELKLVSKSTFIRRIRKEQEKNEGRDDGTSQETLVDENRNCSSRKGGSLFGTITRFSTRKPSKETKVERKPSLLNCDSEESSNEEEESLCQDSIDKSVKSFGSQSLKSDQSMKTTSETGAKSAGSTPSREDYEVKSSSSVVDEDRSVCRGEDRRFSVTTISDPNNEGTEVQLERRWLLFFNRDSKVGEDKNDALKGDPLEEDKKIKTK